MDIDFHFGTIYVLSRWAGFNAGNAKAIATASQLVDDNTPETAPQNYRISGHKPWSNFTDQEDNNEVWFPFHFLPSLDGNSFEEKLICKKNSSMATALSNAMEQFDVSNNIGLFKLGISLHVYADTWAHREFSGYICKDNKVSNPKVISPGELAGDFLEDAIINQFIPLGHAQAIHWPDRPYIEWESTPHFSTGRKNWEEFIEASQSIYSILTKLNSENGTSSVLSLEQTEILTDTFQNIKDEDCDTRNNQWINKINQGEFQFTDEQTLTYSSGFIIADTDFCPAFYTALDEHYNWVKSQLEGAGINDILK